MSEDTISNKPQQSLSTGVARQLATTTKRTPLMEKITPRCLLRLLPWVHVGSGTHRVNRRKVVLKSQKIEISEKNGKVTVRPEHLLSVAFFKDVDASLIESMAKSLVDDMDELLSRVWKKPAFFLAHPRAIAAFRRECTRRGVPPGITMMGGVPCSTWRGVPVVACDKLLIEGKYKNIESSGKTNILLMRVGEKQQGVVGLHNADLTSEEIPSLCVRQMGIDKKAVASYLLTLYFSVAVLVPGALAALENVDVGYYHEYE